MGRKKLLLYYTKKQGKFIIFERTILHDLKKKPDISNSNKSKEREILRALVKLVLSCSKPSENFDALYQYF